MKKFKEIIILILLITPFVLNADNLSNAKELYLKGEFAKALPLFAKELKKKPKNAPINHWYGVCLFETGKVAESVKYLEYGDSKKVIESSHYLGKISIMNYDFAEAIDYYNRYREILTESKKQMSQEAEDELALAKKAKSMFEHVEKIAIIDSILVDKEKFFNYYRLSHETGTLNSTSVLPVEVSNNTVVYSNQSEDRMIWAMPNEDGDMQLCETTKLIDGTWDTPQFIGEELSNGGDINYPFVMQDGSTLYYASNSEDGIGGYDIYMTVKDAETGEYLRPQNLGMPYNSFADDYMLVLDDVTGLGWWATDRNNIEDKVTIYVFVRNDIRQNYSADEENLVSYAKVSDYRATWNGNDYSDLITKIRTLETNAVDNNKDFVFCIKKGVIYTNLNDFNSDEASDEMNNLIELYSELDDIKSELKKKRADYNKATASSKTELGKELISLEKDIEDLRNKIFTQENLVRKLELNN